MMPVEGTIVSLNISVGKGTIKDQVEQVEVLREHGFADDAHAGDWHRQVSLLAQESIDIMVKKGLNLHPGSFAENITTRGLELSSLPVGTRLTSGEVELEVTQIGKKCHTKCNIYKLVGDCIMPREGIFARVIHGGILRRGDTIRLKQ